MFVKSYRGPKKSTWHAVIVWRGNTPERTIRSGLSLLFSISFTKNKRSQKHASMQPQCLYACGNLTSPRLLPHSYHRRLDLIPIGGISIADGKCRGGHLKAKRKENIWSVDNDLAEKAALREKKRRDGAKRRGRRNLSGRKEKLDSRILVSGPMLVELETVLQTQEPVIRPAWDTFTSSISGIWKGVGAVFSPITAEMDPISVNNQRENLYDCYTLSRIEKASADEDGSYSRGPVEISVGEYDERNYFLSPTFKFEQCLVKGCHKRLRVVHTIAFNEGGANIDVIRVAVYEEQWVSPSNLDLADEGTFDLKPFSQRKRTHPSELTGSWKVFEVSATPIFTISDLDSSNTSGSPFVYFCTESLKKRSLPESSFEEQELRDMQDVTILWLPGGVTGYVDVNNEGVLCIGVSWYSDEGINLVMERDYGTDGKLREGRCKSEVKRRWNEPPPM
ncbi:hypothetical protein FCM35_KLT16199 [Carex littledalei]|uniref:Calycin-like protein n=1 Tax=Carex littledalei TaxID=544730 RepID=A0A833RIC0_9POAL|nr:hypothetical protein FCM35_KLT16199 [Carex littledalei]